jgi:hypothetical protein
MGQGRRWATGGGKARTGQCGQQPQHRRGQSGFSRSQQAPQPRPSVTEAVRPTRSDRVRAGSGMTRGCSCGCGCGGSTAAFSSPSPSSTVALGCYPRRALPPWRCRCRRVLGMSGGAIGCREHRAGPPSSSLPSPKSSATPACGAERSARARRTAQARHDSWVALLACAARGRG